MRRNLKEDEIAEWAALSDILPYSGFSNRVDAWLWELDAAGFSRMYLTKYLSTTGNEYYESRHKMIWSDPCPQRVKFFVWELSHSCSNTQDKLQLNSPSIALSPSCCPMCQGNSETHNHLFIDCPFANKIWSYIF